MRARPGTGGQATVEFALLLPLFFGLLALVFQVALVGRDEILVVHAARAAVREAALTPDAGRVEAAGTRALPGAAVRVTRRGATGDPVEVEVTYTSPTDLPLIGALLPDLTLRHHAVMRVER
jgi:Flp pilus assembly protein TadG